MSMRLRSSRRSATNDVASRREADSDSAEDQTEAICSLERHPACMRYLGLCERFGSSPDPSLLICLLADYGIIKPDVRYTALEILPLLSMFPLNSITTLDLTDSKIASNGTVLLSKVLETDQHLHKVVLRNNNIGPRGARVLSVALQRNHALTVLDLHGNRLLGKGAHALVPAVTQNRTLLHLDLSNNHIGWNGVRRLQAAVQLNNEARRRLSSDSDRDSGSSVGSSLLRLATSTPSTSASASASASSSSPSSSASSSTSSSEIQSCCGFHPLQVNLDSNHVRAEVFNSLTHGLGLLLALMGALVMLRFPLSADPLLHSWRHTLSAAVYCFTMVFMFLSSFGYHAVFKMHLLRMVFQRLDHLSIYLLIAGSYTPFCLVSFPGPTGNLLLLIVWVVGGVGILLDAFAWQRFPKLTVAVYLLMGWAGVLFVPSFLVLPRGAVLLTLAGGLSYTGGVYFFVSDKRMEYGHAIWHLFVLLGTALQYLSIYLYVLT